MASLQKSHGKWYAVFSYGKRKDWRPLEIPDTIPKEEARKLLDNLEHKKALGLLDMTQPKAIAFNEYANIYWKHRINDITRETQQSDSYRMDKLNAYFHSRPMAEITYRDLEELVYELKEQGLKDKSVNNILVLCGNIFTRAVEGGYLKEKKWSHLPKLKVRDATPRYAPTPEEIDKFKAAMYESKSDYFPLFCMLTIYLGTRHSEPIFLQWMDINLDQHTVFIRNKPADGFTTKSLKPRAIPIKEELLVFLLDYYQKIKPKPSDWLFPIEHQAARPACSFTKAWKNCIKRAGLEGKKITPHGMRHSLATYLVPDNGIKPVQEILGHRDFSTTMNTYAHLLTEEKRKAMDKLPY